MDINGMIVWNGISGCEDLAKAEVKGIFKSAWTVVRFERGKRVP